MSTVPLNKRELEKLKKRYVHGICGAAKEEVNDCGQCARSTDHTWSRSVTTFQGDRDRACPRARSTCGSTRRRPRS